MSGIVCAIRGGPDSQNTIAVAVDLAKRTGLTLNFLYVVNLEFLERTISARVQAISKEMNQMGEFILFSAQRVASSHGVKANGTVRQGDVLEEISALCHEIGADYLVLGRPKIEDEGTYFTHDQLQEFTQRIENQTGAKAVFSPEEPS